MLCVNAARAEAQEQREPEFGDAGRFRFGPVRYTPSFLVTDIGVDQNIFNSETDPRGDFTTALGPGVEWWLRAQRVRITGINSAQYLFFGTYDSQRAWNTANAFKSELALGRLTPFLHASYQNTRQRQGYEIDVRTRARDSSYVVGSNIRLSQKSTLVISEEREQIRYDRDDVFGSPLADALDRQTMSEHVSLRHALTPLTTFVVKADAIRDRFDVDNVRDANSFRIMPGFELAPFALISGSVFVGFRALNPVNDSVPSYRGVVAAVSANYVLRATRFSGIVNRDLSFSFNPERPYYALTDLGLGVTQRITKIWDARAKVSHQTLVYRTFASTLGDDKPTERGAQYTAGIGYRVGVTLRVGVDATYATRHAPTSAREFRGFRMGASITYGLPE